MHVFEITVSKDHPGIGLAEKTHQKLFLILIALNPPKPFYLHMNADFLKIITAGVPKFDCNANGHFGRTLALQ